MVTTEKMPADLLSGALDVLEPLRREQLCHNTEVYQRALGLIVEAQRMLASQRYQERVALWLEACFGHRISSDKVERNHRFIEEALELVQANGCTQSEAHQLVDYVFNRPTGEPHQEVGGVMVTLAALCWASQLDMHRAGEDELARVWAKIDLVRAKQAAKPKHGPLPGPSAADHG